MTTQPEGTPLRAVELGKLEPALHSLHRIEISEQEDFDEALRWLAALPALQLRCYTLADGRLFSWARQLRRRYGYTGQLTAVGAILPDQVQMLEACGVDTVIPCRDDAVPRFTVAYPS